jgi:YD repeat-containing protein
MKQYFWISVILVFITCLAPSAFGTQYKYDNLHRLTRVIYDNGMQITYTYDEVGNRTQRISTLQADTSIDGTVNFQDFAIIASRWFEEDCGYSNEWCQGADLNWSSKVDIDDLVTLVEQWLAGTSP